MFFAVHPSIHAKQNLVSTIAGSEAILECKVSFFFSNLKTSLLSLQENLYSMVEVQQKSMNFHTYFVVKPLPPCTENELI